MIIQEPSAGISSSASGSLLFKGGSMWGPSKAFAVRHCLSLPAAGEAMPVGKTTLEFMESNQLLSSSWGMNSHCRAVGNI